MENIFKSRSSQDIVFVGDINCDILVDNLIAVNYFALMVSFRLTSLDEPKRVTKNIRTRINPFLAILVVCLLNYMASFNCNNPQNIENVSLTSYKTNIEKLNNALIYQNWSLVYSQKCPLRSYQMFLDIFCSTLENCEELSRGRRKVKELKPWITQTFRVRLRKKSL